MDTLPLYLDDELLAAVETAPLFDVGAGAGSCRRCKLCKVARTVCMQPDVVGAGERTLLVVGEQPSVVEDRGGVPFDDDSGDFVRAEIAKSWAGRVVYDYGVRCRSSSTKVSDLMKSITACRGYLRDVIAEHEPDRIIALGPIAFSALLDRQPPAGSVRKSYAFLSDGTPIFLCLPVGPSLRNRFLTAWLREDLAWACATAKPQPSMWGADFYVVRTPADSRRAVKALRAARWFVFDCETSGVFGDSYFRLLALAACPGRSECPFVWSEDALADPEIRAPLVELLEDPDVGKVGHNAKYDVVTVDNAWGAKVRGIWCDTMMDRNCVQADALARLDVAAELVGMGGIKHVLDRHITLGVEAISKARKQALALAKTGGKQQQSFAGMSDPCIDAAVRLIDVKPKRFAFALIPQDVLLRYVARDVVAPVRLVELQRFGEVGADKSTRPEQVDRRSLSLRWSRLRKPADVTLTKAVSAYVQIERWGIAADRDAMRQFNTYLRQSVDRAAKRLDAEGLSNPNSSEQVSSFLFDKLGLTPNDRFMTTKGPSSSKGHIADLIHRYQDCAGLLNVILDYRRLSKLLGTYAEGLIVHIREDGRIHPHFKIMGATTGRPSCESPNLQVLPRTGTTEGRMMRDCFCVRPGRVLIELDYSQIEIRVAAGLSEDRVMLDIFHEGARSLAAGGKDADLHWKTVRIISQVAWGVDPSSLDPGGARDDQEKSWRSISKVITFGKMYGKRNSTLARELGISIEAADKIDAAILGGYRGFAEWGEQQRRAGRRTGEVWTWWAGDRFRRRPIWQIGDRHLDGRPSARAITAENSCVNSPIQGTGSEFCVQAAIDVVDACERGHLGEGTIVNLTIHDALILEADEELAPMIIPKVKAIMLQHPTPGGVPFAVDAKVGRSLGSLKEYHG